MLDFTNLLTGSDLLTSAATDVTFVQAVVTIAITVLLGLVISFTYKLTTDKAEYSPNFFLTLILIPAVIAIIILLIGSNVARAFSLAGAFSIIRFRSAPGNPKDITYVLFSMAAGLACGMGSYIYSFFFTLVLCVLMVIFYAVKLGSVKESFYTLKITIPEDLNFKGAFDDVLDKYTKSYTLGKIKTADMGSVFELTYGVTLPNNADIKDFMDEVRCRNGNLTVLLSHDANNREF